MEPLLLRKMTNCIHSYHLYCEGFGKNEQGALGSHVDGLGEMVSRLAESAAQFAESENIYFEVGEYHKYVHVHALYQVCTPSTWES